MKLLRNLFLNYISILLTYIFVILNNTVVSFSSFKSSSEMMDICGWYLV